MKLINKNVLDALKELPDESVDCVITSPPYYGIRSFKCADTIWGGDPECVHEWTTVRTKRENSSGGRPSDSNPYAKKLSIKGVTNYSEFADYHDRATYSDVCSKCGAWKGQLGFEPTFQTYFEHLIMVTRELKRVLKPTGTLFWNMGDSYASSGGSSRHRGYADPKWNKARDGSFDEPTSYDQGIEPKSLMMLPERFALAMIDDGWILRNKIIWRKKNGMPSSVKDRFSNKWEYVFFFTKRKKYFFDLDAVRKPLAESPVKRISQKNIPNQFQSGKSFDFSRENPNMSIPRILNNMYRKYEESSSHEGKQISYFNEEGTISDSPKGANPGDVVETPAVRSKSLSFNADLEINHEREYDPDADGGDFISIATIPHKDAHFSIFPETLVAPLIKAGCPKGGVVLDPFAGSGTTGVVAQVLGRDSILIEISSEYCDIINERFKSENIQKVAKLIKSPDPTQKTLESD